MNEQAFNPEAASSPQTAAVNTLPAVRPAVTKDIIFMAVYFVLSVAAVNLGLFGGFNLGYTLTAGAITVFTFVYSAMGNRLSVFGGYFALCAVVISAGFTLGSSGAFKLVGFFFVWAMLLLVLLDNTGCGRFSPGGWSRGVDMLRLAFCTPFERMSVTVASFKETGKNKSLFKRFGGAAIGVLCALPALALILPLLMSSDAAFDTLLRKTVFTNLPRLLASVILGFIFFLLTFVSVFAAKNKMVYTTDRIPKTVPEKGISVMGANSFLSVISFVYAVYLLSQLSYFFSAFSGLMPQDFTLAQYARRGFFEMSVICLINLIIIGLSLILVRRGEKGNPPRSTRMICMFISLFSLAIVATVCAKLWLYMKELGLTRLRVYTTLFCAALAVVFICIAVRLFCRRFPYFRVCTVIIAAAFAFLSVVNIDSVIAGYNYNAYKSGLHSEIDIETIGKLDESGVPYLVKLLDDENEDVRRRASSKLAQISVKYGFNDTAGEVAAMNETHGFFDGYAMLPYNIEMTGEFKCKDIDFRSYNKPYAEAQALIAENWEKIMSNYNETNNNYE